MDALSTSAAEAAVSPELGSIEQPFIGRWNKLVSTTNWQKGEIIQQWRDALIEAGAAVSEYSDEAWSQRVGGVTPQHVGRLRRVFQRFDTAREKFPVLFWSHFQAALDWDDAEMWLEGALQSEWSVAEMRRTRHETLGLAAAENVEPQSEDLDEDDQSEPQLDSGPQSNSGRAQTHEFDDGLGLVPEGPDFGDEGTGSASDDYSEDGDYSNELSESTPSVRPFETLGELPGDFADAFESLKLAILRHKNDHWTEMKLDDALAALDALKELARAPSETAA